MRKPKLKRRRTAPQEAILSEAPISEREAHILKLLEEWTRYETAARLLPVDCKVCIDYYREMLDKEDEIRIYLWGESELTKLAKILHIDIGEERKKKVYIREPQYVVAKDGKAIPNAPFVRDPVRDAKRDRLKAEHDGKPYDAERGRLGLSKRKTRGRVDSTDDGMTDAEFDAWLGGE